MTLRNDDYDGPEGRRDTPKLALYRQLLLERCVSEFSADWSVRHTMLPNNRRCGSQR